MNTPNPELQLAEAFVRDTNRHIFLTGKAGTGKTTFLHRIKDKTPKRAVVTAPTGVAAINAGGVTLHSFFQIPFGPFLPGSETHLRTHRIRREKQETIRSLDLLIIDEISMVRADLLDCVDAILRRYRRTGKPFGGVQLLMIGDLHQLAPVVPQAERQLLQPHYETPYFFSSTALARTEMVPIELKHIYRQSDPGFIDLLNRVRDNRLDPPVLDRLNARHIAGFRAPDAASGFITLCTHNRAADALNAARLKALPGNSRRFTAVQEGDFPEQAFPTDAVLELKLGAQVMFVRNDMSAEKRYFNGKIGTVTGMAAEAIEVRCPGEADPIRVVQSTWENIEYQVDPKTAEITQKIIGTFSQFPLRTAWAITIHKSQGLTFDKAIIDAEDAFAYGQVYVALSRCRTLDGIVLSTPLRRAAVRIDRSVARFVTEASARPPSAEDLQAARSDYQQQLLLECFDFDRLGGLLGRVAMLLHRYAAVIQVTPSIDAGALRKAVDADICTVGASFRRQLQGMFNPSRLPDADAAILDRLAKAAVYFEDKFAAHLSPVSADLQVETDNKEVRKQINDALKRLRQEIAEKLAGVRACGDGFAPERYLRALSMAAMAAAAPKARPAASLYTAADIDHPDLFEALREWRRRKSAEEGVAQFQVMHQKTLVQIAVHLPDSLPALKKIKGIGKRLAEKYGHELTAMVAAYRHLHNIETVSPPEPAAPPPEKKPKVHTRQITRDLFAQGLTIAEIAARRNLSTTTIEGHIAHFVSAGDIDIATLVPEPTRRKIEQAVTSTESRSLKTLKEALGHACAYGEIKLVLAHLNRSGRE